MGVGSWELAEAEAKLVSVQPHCLVESHGGVGAGGGELMRWAVHHVGYSLLVAAPLYREINHIVYFGFFFFSAVDRSFKNTWTKILCERRCVSLVYRIRFWQL